MNLGEGSNDLLLHDPKDHPAQNRSPDRCDAADNRHQEDVHAGLKSEYTLRMDECRVSGEDSTDHAGQRGGEGMRFKLVGVRVYAKARRGILVLTNGIQSQSKFSARNKY